MLALAQTPMQTPGYTGSYVVESIVVDGDTIPVVTLAPADVSSIRRSRSKRYQREYSKLYRRVIKTYPYARVAGDLLKAYEEEMALLETTVEKEVYLDQAEADLKAEFEGELKKLSMSQGRILIKLIDRETGKTSYELIRELRSGFTAFMWQGMAKLFGSDLKSQYDPTADDQDAMIEEIVQLIESGEIAVERREAKTTAAKDALAASNKRLQKKIEKEKKKNK